MTLVDRRHVYWAVGLVLASTGALAQEAETDPPPLPAMDLVETIVPEAEETYPIHGFLRVGTRARFTNDASDSDLFAFLTVDGGDANRNDVTFHVTARVWQDLGQGTSPGNPFFEVTDTYSNGFQALVYRAYAEVHSVESLDFIRVGRQEDIDTPEPAYYDGVHVRSRTDRDIWGGAYGGLSNHLFESTTSDDRLVGTYVGARPWTAARVRFDWMQARDSRRTGGSPQDMVSAGLWQSIGQNVHLDGYVSMLENKGRDLRFTGRWYEPENDVQVRASYYGLLRRQTTNALDFDMFSSTLLATEPFHQFSLNVSHMTGVDKSIRVNGGVDIRRLDSSADEGQFNREFERYFLSTTYAGFTDESMSVGATVDFWDGDGTDYATLGIDFAADLKEDVRGSIGTYYSKYKTRIIGLEEREDVRTYFARVDWKLSDDWSFDFAYNFENSSIDDFHFLRADLRWRF